ncbi:MAG: phosphoheptose isomerase family protein [Candidatus Latescibacterota bacterium]
MRNTSRRTMLRTGALLGAGMVSGNTLPTAPANAAAASTGSKWDDEYNFGHTILFMEEYLQGTLAILGCLSGEIGHIADLAERAVSVQKAGGTVWNSAHIGHMPATEQNEKRRGNPAVMKAHTLMTKVQSKAEMPESDFSDVKKGDMIITCYCNRSLQQARDRGAYVVTVPVNYINNEFWPEGYVLPNEDNLMLKDVSNEILHSYIPYEQGLVHPPEIPYMAICPSCTTALGALYWMLSAEIAQKFADPKAVAGERAAEYLAILTDRVKRIGERHLVAIRETAVEMTHRVRDGGRWFVRSPEHSGLASELVRVASGPWMPNTGDWNARKTRNIMLISGISPAYPEDIKLALEKQVEGAYVIGVGPAAMDGVVPRGRLIDVADAGFDNFSPEFGGVLRFPGRKESTCPTSGIMSNVIQQMICAQWADEMCRRGSVPYFLLGNYRGGRIFNPLLAPSAAKRGY